MKMTHGLHLKTIESRQSLQCIPSIIEGQFYSVGIVTLDKTRTYLRLVMKEATFLFLFLFCTLVILLESNTKSTLMPSKHD